MEHGKYLNYFVFGTIMESFPIGVVHFNQEICTNMETNNFVESWHNELKTWYLGHPNHQHLNAIIAILVQEG